MGRAAVCAVLATGLVLPGGPVLGQVRGVPGGAAADGRIPLGTGDRVNVTVLGFADLSGDYTVDDQGRITLPIGGPVKAQGLTVDQLEQAITATLSDGFLLRPKVGVRISEFRSVYVLGDVRNNGAVAFHPGMTAVIAVALAGGIGSGPGDAVSRRGELLEVEERLQGLLSRRLALRARIARLTALRDGAGALAFPSSLDPADAATRQVLNGETALFDSDRAAQAMQLGLARQQIENAGNELASINEQIRLQQGQLVAMAAYAADLSKLARDGLVDRRRVMDTQQEKARIEANLARLGTEATRASQAQQQGPARMAEILTSARQQALQQLQEAQSRLSEVESGIETSRQIAALRRPQGRLDALSRDSIAARMTVTRAGPGGPQTITVEDNDRLLPGDMLRVGAPMQAAGAAEAPSASGPFAAPPSLTPDIRRP